MKIIKKFNYKKIIYVPEFLREALLINIYNSSVL